METPMNKPVIPESDFTALLNMRDQMDKDITSAQSRYMKRLFIELRAIVAIRVVKAQAARERANLATHRSALDAFRTSASSTLPES